MIYSKVLNDLVTNDADYKEEIGILISHTICELENMNNEECVQKTNYIFMELLDAYIHTSDKEKKQFLFISAKKLDEALTKHKKGELHDE